MPEVNWTEAPQSVIHTAEAIIHTMHPKLRDARIAFVFRDKAQKQGERFILGQCTKVPAKFQPLLEYDYIIWLSEDDYAGMTDKQREALIFHELYHIKYNYEADSWSIRPHDVQEFSAVIERYGIYSPDVRKVKEAMDKYETQTLPGLLDNAIEMSYKGRVVSMTGRELERAAQALGD